MIPREILMGESGVDGSLELGSEVRVLELARASTLREILGAVSCQFGGVVCRGLFWGTMALRR